MKKITKKEFLKKAEQAWNTALEYGDLKEFSFIFESEDGWGSHSGTMDCGYILLWALHHNVSRYVNDIAKDMVSKSLGPELRKKVERMMVDTIRKVIKEMRLDED